MTDKISRSFTPYSFTEDRPFKPEKVEPENWGSTADYVLLSDVINIEYSPSGKDLIYAVVNKTTKHVEWRAKTLPEALQALSSLQEALDAERGSAVVRN